MKSNRSIESLGRRAVALTVVLLLSATSINAQTVFTIPIGDTRTLPSATTNDRVSSIYFGKRSYCCSLFNVTRSGLPSFSSASGFSGLAATSLIVRGNEGNRLCASAASECRERRQCWFEDPALATANLRQFIVEQPIAGDEPIETRCEETTLVGGFNTVVTDFNFLELSATARLGAEDENITGFAILKRTITGTTVTLPFTLDFNNQPNVRQDISIHDAIGNADDFGQVIVIHNGPPGVVKVRVSQYRIVSVSPLDFEPVLQEVLVPRVE